jgi:predicted heme/steroid binding protein
MSELLKLLPKKIKISFADVDIETSDDTKFTEENFGEYDSRNNKITISTNSTDRDIANTLLHEIVHASVWYGGLKDDGAALEDDKHEEHVVNVLTNQLCQIFRDNPKILTIIKKGLTGKNGRAKKGDQVMATPEKILERYTFHKNRK